MGARLRALTARRTDHLAADLGDEKPALGTPPPSLRSLPRWRSDPNCRPRYVPNQVMTRVPPIPRPPRRASRPILSHVTELYLTGSYVYAGGLPGGGIIASAANPRYIGGKPPVATGPHRRGVTRIRHLPWSSMARR